MPPDNHSGCQHGCVWSLTLLRALLDLWFPLILSMHQMAGKRMGTPISPATLTPRTFTEMISIKYRIRKLQNPQELLLNSTCLLGIKKAVPPDANTELSPRDLAEP